MRNKPYVFRGIAISALMLIVHFVMYVIAFAILSFIFLFLLELPLIGKLFNILFFLRGDTPTMVAQIIAAQIAYYATKFIQTKTNKHLLTKGLSYKICGIVFLIIYVPSLVINIFDGAGSSIFANILFIITAGIYFWKASDCKEEFLNTDDQEIN